MPPATPEDLIRLLDGMGIAYARVDHPPVYTVEEAERLVPPLEGAHTKNLFLRDKPGARHLLVSVGYDKSVDLKALGRLLGIPKLSFASGERLMRHLGVEPGAVTLLGAVNDRDGAVEVLVDRALWRAGRVKCHPLVNTATLSLKTADVERILGSTGHAVRVIDVPGRDA